MNKDMHTDNKDNVIALFRRKEDISQQIYHPASVNFPVEISNDSNKELKESLKRSKIQKQVSISFKDDLTVIMDQVQNQLETLKDRSHRLTHYLKQF